MINENIEKMVCAADSQDMKFNFDSVFEVLKGESVHFEAEENKQPCQYIPVTCYNRYWRLVFKNGTGLTLFRRIDQEYGCSTVMVYQVSVLSKEDVIERFESKRKKIEEEICKLQEVLQPILGILDSLK